MMKDLIKKVLQFRMFHPAEWFVKRKTKFGSEVLNPPSWRERKIQNEIIERRYEETVRAKADKEEPSWVDKDDQDFKNMKQEVVRVIEFDE